MTEPTTERHSGSAALDHEDGASAVLVEGISKRFGATQALDDVSLAINQVEIRGLIGENGAGKSTLLKVLSGLVRPDEGAISVFGSPYRAHSPLDAHAMGVQTAFQELTLVEDLSVARNLLIPYEPRGPLGLVSRSATLHESDRILASFGVTSISPHAEVRDLSLSDRQKIEIIRAAARSPRLLLLDEATSALSARDVRWLYELVGRLKQSGVVVVFISHRISEIRDLCDSISILRNGRHVSTAATADVSDAEIVRLVIGRSLDSAFPAKPKIEAAGEFQPTALSARDLHVDTAVNGADLDLRQGQILGLAGLDGMGQRELFSALFGALPVDRGTISVGKRAIRPKSPLDAMGEGIGYVPSDRRREGVLIHQSGALNISLPVLDRYARFGVIDLPRLRPAIALYLEKLKIHPRALYREAGSFSGGNQQKIVIAKWLLAGPPVLLMNDPTRGVDVGTKFDIFTIMREFADAGGAILFHSTELNELVNMCSEIIVIYRGKVVDEISGDQVSEERLMGSMLGEGRNGSGG